MATDNPTVNSVKYYGTATFKDVNDNLCYLGTQSTESMTVADVNRYKMLTLQTPEIYNDTSREVKYYDVKTQNRTVNLTINNKSGSRRVVDYVRIYWNGEPYVDTSSYWITEIKPGAIASGSSYSTTVTLINKGAAQTKLRVQMGKFSGTVNCTLRLQNYGSYTMTDPDGNGIFNVLLQTIGSYMIVANAVTAIVIDIT